MAGALGNVTGAQDVAAANSRGLSGVIDALKNTVDTASLSLFETLQPSIMKVADAATGLVGPLAEGLAPALGSVADLATGTLAPAIGALTGVISAVAGPVAGLIGWIGDLPGPIGAATLALGGVILLRGPLTATFASWAASAGTMLATLRGTAGAAAAGSAGLAGWIASLRAASGAAATFGVVAKGALAVLGGPIGLAIIGVTTALSLFSSGSDDASGSTEDFTSALDEQTGALKDNAAQVFSAKVESSGLGDAYRAIGGSTADLVDALGGFADKQAIVNQTIAEAQSAATSAGVATNSLGQVVGSTSNELQGMSTSFNNTSAAAQQNSVAFLNAKKSGDLFAELSGTLTGKQTELQNAAAGASGELGKASGAMDDAAVAAGKAEEAATPFGDALKDIRSAASEADAAAQFLSITLLQMAGNTVPAEQRARANAAAFRAVGQATRDIGDANDSVAEKQRKFDDLAAHLGGTLDGQAASATNARVTQEDLDAAGRDLADAQAGVQNATDKQKDALDKAAQSARDMTAEAYNGKLAQGNYRGAVEDAVATMVAQREQFIKSAVDAGIARDAAEKLADAQGLIPANVRTTYETVGAEDATTQAKNLNAALDKINDRTVRYSVEGGEVTALGALPVVGGKLAVRAQGGIVTGPGTGTSDSIPALISNGEYVVRASQTAKHLPLLHAINSGAPGFADGGLVGAKVLGEYKSPDFTAQLQSSLDGWISKVKESLAFSGISGGLNQSQDPSSFGWKRASGITPYSWNGNPIFGGVAGGTQGLWGGLLSALVPQIPGGLVGPMWGYANRDNVNSPGNASFHSYGLAVDVNAEANPNGAPGDGRSGRGVIPAGAARSLASRFGMLWGGDFRGTPDPMHFEIHVAPNQINGSSVSGAVSLAGSSAGVEGWRPTVLQALARTGQSASLADIVLNQMRTESSGNTQAINNWDSNAKRGTPSKGLMQVIDPTFQTYRDRGLLNDIWNPMANIVASINYTLARYGSLSAGMRGVAYDNGGILPPGFTMAYNGTGQNEQIFTRDQMVSGGGGGVNVDLAREIANLKAAIADMPRGLNIENINASSAGQVVAEIDHVFARCG
jgi:hypothetical protein